MNYIVSSTQHQNQRGANWLRKGSEQHECHNKSAHTDSCSSGSGSVLWAADVQEQLWVTDVFITTCFQSEDKLTNIMCDWWSVQTGSVLYLSLYWNTSGPVGPPEGRDFISLYLQGLWDYWAVVWVITEHNLKVLIRPGSVDPDNLHRWTPLCDVWG